MHLFMDLPMNGLNFSKNYKNQDEQRDNPAVFSKPDN